MMDWRKFVCCVLLGGHCLVLKTASCDEGAKKPCEVADTTIDEDPAKDQPNIVFIVADDMGYNDIGINNPDVSTPILDGLARKGRVLRQHYSSMMCTPSRAAFLTGRYPHKVQMQHFILTNTMPHCLPSDVPALPEILKTLGYSTHLVGKWHLGFCQKHCIPTQRGFDSFYGLYGGMADQFSHYTVPPDAEGYDFQNQSEPDLTVIGNHTTDVFSQRAAEMIRGHKGNDPFFLMLSYTIPHTPIQVPQRYLDMYADVTNEKRRGSLGMISHMDDGIGLVVAALNESNLLDKTVIVFVSDNGGDPSHGHSNAPYRGGKGSLWEGGSRTVAFVYGSMVEGTGETDELFHGTDWSPTFLAMAGRTQADPEEDGVDQSDLLLRGGVSKRQNFVYNIDLERPFVFGQAAIREGPYKLIWGYEGAKDGWGEGAGQTWTVPWNMELLGLDPVNDTLVRPPGMGDLVLLPEEVERRRLLMQIKAMNPSDIDSGFVYLFNLDDDPYEKTNLANRSEHADKVLQMKQKVLEIINTDYLKPQSLVTADWGSEAKKLFGDDNAWRTGWCNNVTILAYPNKTCKRGGAMTPSWSQNLSVYLVVAIVVRCLMSS